ncbi:FMRFamide receptor-like [Saccostrea cucullata]|uniref:FMRFamide receptor-like n=1 Tax=Saccostrea cuccullata TaxID=36930 RepID=UPI002ED50B4B
MIVLGTVGNIFSIVILLRKNLRRHTTVIYLVTLSLNDLVVLYTGLLRNWIKITFGIDVRLFSEFSCKFHLWMVYLSVDISAWLLVTVTLERVALVWFPHASKHRCNKHVAGIILGSLIGILMLVNAHILYGIGDVTKKEDNRTVLRQCYYETNVYEKFYENVWPWIDLAKFNAIPFAIILIGNVCIITNVIKTHKKLNVRVAPGGIQQKSKRIHSMTTTLIVLNTTFLISTTPISIYLANYNKWSENATNEEMARLVLLWAVTNLLMYSNNTINFLLYCVSGSNFRNEIRYLFGRKMKVGGGSHLTTRLQVQPTASRTISILG